MTTMVRVQNWSLNKIIVVVLILGFAMLILDIRSEHVDVVRRDWKAWIPIYYSGAMILLGLVGLALWDKGGRQFLVYAFAASLIVGALGFWFHTHGQLISGFMTVLDAWTQPLRHKDAPPAFAPLSFAGLGLIGILTCVRRFQQTVPTEAL